MDVEQAHDVGMLAEAAIARLSAAGARCRARGTTAIAVSVRSRSGNEAVIARSIGVENVPFATYRLQVNGFEGSASILRLRRLICTSIARSLPVLSSLESSCAGNRDTDALRKEPQKIALALGELDRLLVALEFAARDVEDAVRPCGFHRASRPAFGRGAGCCAAAAATRAARTASRRNRRRRPRGPRCDLRRRRAPSACRWDRARRFEVARQASNHIRPAS